MLSADGKRDAMRHLVTTVAYRGVVAIADVPKGFTTFRAGEGVRAPRKILAHFGNLPEGSLYLLKGELTYLASSPL
jgi:hypothetical protein